MANYNLPAKPKFFDGKLYQRMSDDLQLAGMGQRIVHGYLRSVRQLADYCQRSPAKVTENQLREFFLHLKNERNFAHGSMRSPSPALSSSTHAPAGETGKRWQR